MNDINYVRHEDEYFTYYGYVFKGLSHDSICTVNAEALSSLNVGDRMDLYQLTIL